MFRWIRRIKRHKRNKKLLMFAEALYENSRTSQLGIFVHPLIFEIIRFHHFGEMCSNIMSSDMVKLTEMIVDMEWINGLKRMGESVDIEVPFEQVAQPELFMPKII